MASNPSSRATNAGLCFNPNVAGLPVYNAGMNVAVARTVDGCVGDVRTVATLRTLTF